MAELFKKILDSSGLALPGELDQAGASWRAIELPKRFVVVQDLHEKVGFDAFRRSDYLEVDRVYDGPAARWNALKPLKATNASFVGR